MITDLYMQLLKEFAAKYYQCSIDRLQVQFKQFSVNSADAGIQSKEIQGLFYIIDSFIPSPDDAYTLVAFSFLNYYSIVNTAGSTLAGTLSRDSLRNTFADRILVESNMCDSYSPMITYLEFTVI